VLHVGLPKTGTTFLQSTLAAHREALADRGVLVPPQSADLMFRASLDVRGNHEAWGRERSAVAGAWDEACRAARAHPGTTVLSHELLAAATGRQVDAALSMLRGLEVHLVVTARDLARQLVAEWQEGVKHGRRLTFEDFEQRVRSGRGGHARHFHAAQDLPDVLERWGRGIPRDRVHVVVAGPPGTPAEQLWVDLAEAAGFSAEGLAPAGPGQSNASLGVAEIDLLRRVNEVLDGRLRQPAYGRLVKHALVPEALAGRPSPRPVLPAQLHEQVVPVAQQWVKEVVGAGYTVHGDLDDLLLADRPAGTRHPDEVDPGSQVDTAAGAIATLLLRLEAAEARAEERDDKRRSWKRQAKELRRRVAELSH
jgi:hypothetical protein